MRLAVDSPALAETSVTFERANQSAATFHSALRSRLQAGAAMAGDSSVAASFAAAYDEAAQLALDAVGDLVTAFATCGRLVTACEANHARAEARSVLGGGSVYEGTAPVRGYVSVLDATVPSSLGGDSKDIPGWAGWILDQVEGFAWPDADVPRLRATATAWRAAATQAGDLTSFCSTAVSSLAVTRSPEIPLAVETTERLATHCHTVAAQCDTLADACTTYADQVEAARAETLDLVHDLLRDAVVIQGIGIVLGIVTGGTTAAGAAAINAAKIAAAAPRFLRILSLLRTLAATCSAPVRASVTSLAAVRRDLVVFKRARATLVSTYDAERVARVARLQSIVRHPRLTDPEAFRGLSRQQVREMLDGWKSGPSKSGEGVVFKDPVHSDRQFRIMEGYRPDERPNPLTHGPYLVISQNNNVYKIPLEGNPTL